MSLKFKNLKQAKFFQPFKPKNVFDRYVVETQEDLDAFAKAFPLIKNRLGMYENLRNNILEGYTVILTDEHPMTGLPTYCFESKTDLEHPSAFVRK